MCFVARQCITGFATFVEEHYCGVISMYQQGAVSFLEYDPILTASVPKHSTLYLLFDPLGQWCMVLVHTIHVSAQKKTLQVHLRVLLNPASSGRIYFTDNKCFCSWWHPRMLSSIQCWWLYHFSLVFTEFNRKSWLARFSHDELSRRKLCSVYCCCYHGNNYKALELKVILLAANNHIFHRKA